MNEKFGELRALMHLPELEEGERNEVWQLMCDAYAQDRAHYQAVWVPYLSGFKHHWEEPWSTHRDLSELKEAMEMAPFAWFAARPLAMGEELVRLLVEMPNLERLRSLKLSQSRLDDALLQTIVSMVAFPEVLSLDLSTNYLTAQSMRHLQESQAFQKLETLVLRRCPSLGDEGISCLSRVDIPLKHLVLHYVGCGAQGAKALSEAGELWNLEALDLSANRIGALGMKHLSSVQSWTQFRRLNLSNNTLNEQAAASLAQAPYFKQLTHLDVSANPIRGGIAQISRSSVALTSLNVTKTGLDPEHMFFILEMLQHQTMRVLKLGGNRFDERSVCALASSPHLHTLRSLDLSHMRIDADGARALAASNLLSLRELRLGFTQLTPTSMKELTNATWFENIQNLNLSCNDLGGNGALEFLSEVDVSQLRSLHLESTGLTDVDIPALLQLDLRSLNTLDLKHNHLGPEGVRLLVQQDPWPNLGSLYLLGNESLRPGDIGNDSEFVAMLEDWRHRREGRDIDLL